MSIFGKIKDAIFGKKDAPAPTGQAQPPAGTTTGGGATAQAPTTQPQPQAQQVDVEQVLTGIAASKGNPDLNWRTSIVDLMKLLGMESSLAERKELAAELGYTGDTGDSAKMNVWLHKQVIQKLKDNGGKVPADLL